MKKAAAICLIVLFVTTIGYSEKSSAGPIAIYVYTAQSADGFQDEALIRRLDTVDDLRDVLAKRDKGKRYRLVDSADQAQLVLQVTISAETPAGTITYKLGTVESTTQATEPTIAATLSIRGSTYSRELRKQKRAFWKNLAIYLVDDLDKWVDMNQQNLKQ